MIGEHLHSARRRRPSAVLPLQGLPVNPVSKRPHGLSETIATAVERMRAVVPSVLDRTPLKSQFYVGVQHGLCVRASGECISLLLSVFPASSWCFVCGGGVAKPGEEEGEEEHARQSKARTLDAERLPSPLGARARVLIFCLFSGAACCCSCERSFASIFTTRLLAPRVVTRYPSRPHRARCSNCLTCARNAVSLSPVSGAARFPPLCLALPASPRRHRTAPHPSPRTPHPHSSFPFLPSPPFAGST